MSLGKNIARVRERAGLSQAELARKLKKSRSSVNEYESGRHEPPVLLLRRIAKLTGADIAELLS